MEFRKIKNKEGEVLTTKEGNELVELRLEIGDEIIPLFNDVLEKSREVEINGQTKTIVNSSLKCKARDVNGQTIMHNGEEEVFVSLTPAQAKSMKKKATEGLELNQNVFTAYEYISKNYGKQIGVGLKKSNKPAKTFEDFAEVSD